MGVILKKKTKIVFCNAPYDIGHALALYERFKESHNIIIYVLNIPAIYKFLNSLNIKGITIYFIPKTPFNIKNPINLIAERKRLRTIYYLHFKSLKSADIYFFTLYYDYVLFYLLNKLYKHNKLFYYDQYKAKDTEKISQHIKKVAYFIMTGIFFDFWNSNIDTNSPIKLPSRILEETTFIDIEDKELSEVYKKHKPTNLNFLPESIVFFENNLTEYKEIKNYDKTLENIINVLIRSKGKIYLKGHPRLGLSDIIKNKGFEEIDSFIPSEFITDKNIRYYIAVISNSLSMLSKLTSKQSIYLIDLFDWENEKTKSSYKKHFSELCENVMFPDTINEFEAIITSVHSG
ncbi:MAG: hypothetical protein PHX21_09040 [bacterium]|nr:hypothetical protein [bacterium]